MNLLLDTQAILWFWWADSKLSSVASAAICDPTARKLVSPASPWEVAIKVSRKKLDIGGPFRGFFPQQMQRNNFVWLPILDDHLVELIDLPFHHKDPFDRLLIAQALTEKIPIVSADAQLDAYGVTRIW